jgi:hypothetical protein
MKLSNIIDIPTSCDPSFYTTEDDLNGVEIGDVLTVTFKDKERVKPKYRGKTVKFLVNNFLPHNWRRPTRRLALIPLNSVNLETSTFNKSDVIILDDSDRFDCLMIDLFDINKVPFKGWKKKKVTFVKDGTLTTLERDYKLKELTKDEQ